MSEMVQIKIKDSKGIFYDIFLNSAFDQNIIMPMLSLSYYREHFDQKGSNF